MATSSSSPRSRDSEHDEIHAAAAHAPGAIPQTEGVPPRGGSYRPSEPDERTVAEDLADGLELLRRAARKTLHAADPRLEALAERALFALRDLDDEAEEQFVKRRETLERAAQDAGREIAGAIERVSQRIEAAVRGGQEGTKPG